MPHGFVEKPFSLTPDPRFLYLGESCAAALDLLHLAIERREGFVVITGDAGTGKTTLCRALVERSDPQTFTALVLNAFHSEEDLLEAVLQDLGVLSRGVQRRAGRRPGRQDLINALHDFLLSLIPLGGRLVLIVDEAQNVPAPLLEQVRILSNLETQTEKLLQIVLVGHPGLLDLLASRELRQLDQRVSVRYQLTPLSESEVAAYIAHRLALARPAHPVAFTTDAVRFVHACSQGVPRLVNMLCDRALVGSATARIDREMVVDAARGLDLKPRGRAERSLVERLLGIVPAESTR